MGRRHHRSRSHPRRISLGARIRRPQSRNPGIQNRSPSDLSKLEIILRTLLANFIVDVLPLLLILAGILLVIKAQKSGPGSSIRRYLGISLVSLPVGIIAYIIAGIAAARIRGDGHFYGVPFGGYSVSNNTADLISVLVWVALVFVGLAGALHPRQAHPPGTN